MITDPYKSNIHSDTQNHIPYTKTKPTNNKTKLITFNRINSISEGEMIKTTKQPPPKLIMIHHKNKPAFLTN